MKRLFQLFIAIALCFSFTSNVYADNETKHDLSSDKAHISFTLNQAGDELSVALKLSEEMYNRQISTLHLILNTSSSIKGYNDAFQLDNQLKSTSIYNSFISNSQIDLFLSNKTKLFDKQEVTLGTIRIDSDSDFNIEITPHSMDYVLVGDNAQNSITFDCPSAVLTNKSDEGNKPDDKPTPDVKPTPDEKPTPDDKPTPDENIKPDETVKPDDSSDNNQNETHKIVVDTSVEELGVSQLQMDEKSQAIVSSSVMKYLNENYAENLKNLPEGAVIKAALSMENVTVNDLSAQQKDSIQNVLVEGANICTYYDISILATAYLNDEILADINGIKIPQLNEPIQLSLTIPSEFIKTNRQFGIVRLHNDKAMGLASTVENGNVIHFETDCFSIYTLVSKDYTQAEVDKDPNVLTSSIVKTSDDSTIIPYVIMISGVLVVIGLLLKKRKMLNQHK